MSRVARNTLTLNMGRVVSMAISADGQRIVSQSADRTLKVWDTTSGQQIVTLSGNAASRLSSVAFSPDGRRIVGGLLGPHSEGVGPDERPGDFDAQRSRWTECLALAFSPDGQRIVSGSRDDTVKLWDATSGHETLTLRGTQVRSSVAFSPDGRRIVSGLDDAEVVGCRKRPEESSLRGHTCPVKSVAFSPDGRELSVDH